MRSRSALRFVVTAILITLPIAAMAASPASGSLASKNDEVTWSGGPFYLSNPLTTAGATKQVPCDLGSPTCDTFRVTVASGSVKQVLIAIAPNAGFEDDDYDLHVYDDKGVRIAESAGEGGNEAVVINTGTSAYFDVRVQPYLVDAGSAYTGVVQPSRGEPVDTVRECLEAVPEQIGSTVLDGGQRIELSVMLLLDGTDEAAAKTLMARAAESYKPLNIDLVLVKTKAVTYNTSVSTELISAAKTTVGGVPPRGIDLVGVFTTKGMQSATGGAGTVVGQADCIGGIRWDDTSFFVVTDIRNIENPTTGQTGTLNSMGLNPNVDAAAEVFAHEIGHLIGAHHHYSNCVEGQLTSAGPTDVSPCTLMFPAVNFASLNFAALEAATVRGHAVKYAAP